MGISEVTGHTLVDTTAHDQMPIDMITIITLEAPYTIVPIIIQQGTTVLVGIPQVITIAIIGLVIITTVFEVRGVGRIL